MGRIFLVKNRDFRQKIEIFVKFAKHFFLEILNYNFCTKPVMTPREKILRPAEIILSGMSSGPPGHPDPENVRVARSGSGRADYLPGPGGRVDYFPGPGGRAQIFPFFSVT